MPGQPSSTIFPRMANLEGGSEIAGITRHGDAREFPAKTVTVIASVPGLLNPFAIRTIKHRRSVPVIRDRGAGTPPDACLTTEQGVDAILIDAGIATWTDSGRMATA